jgi:hypothetical protein
MVANQLRGSEDKQDEAPIHSRIMDFGETENKTGMATRNFAAMIQIGCASFQLTFEPQIANRELVVLGVVPIGAIDRHGGGCWLLSLDLPIARRLSRVHSREEARRHAMSAVTDWLEAAAAPARERSNA